METDRRNRRKVWAFLGDGEMDEPESGAISLASVKNLIIYFCD